MDKNKLIKAYGELLQQLHATLDETLHSFAEALEISKHKTRESHGLTHEEANKLSDFVKRDVEHAAHQLDHQADNESLKEWLKFDIEMIENFALDAFLSVADKTRIELAKLQQKAITHRYQHGDIVSPGTFVCEACGKEIAFKAPSEIPPCPACHAESFVRL